MSLEQFSISTSELDGLQFDLPTPTAPFHLKNSLNFDMVLCVGLFWTALMPFSLHSMMEVGSLRSSGATSTFPIPLLFLSMEVMSTGRTGGRTLWREPISGLGKMSQLSRRQALSRLTCRSSTPAGSHKVRTAYLALFCLRWEDQKKGTFHYVPWHQVHIIC